MGNLFQKCAAGYKAAEPMHRRNDKLCKVIRYSEERTVAGSQAHHATLGNSSDDAKETQRLQEEQEAAGPRRDVEGMVRHTCVLNGVRVYVLWHLKLLEEACPYSNHTDSLFHRFCADMSFSARAIKAAAEHASLPFCEPSVVSTS